MISLLFMVGEGESWNVKYPDVVSSVPNLEVEDPARRDGLVV